VTSGEIEIRALVRPATTQVGESVQFSIEIDNARGRIMGPEVTVDGLEVVYRGTSQRHQTQLGTGGSSSTSTFSLNYEVVAKREGDFTIPALNVVVDGKTLQTKPVALKVQKGGGATAQADSAIGKAFAEIRVKKGNIYIGQAVPVEVRLYIDSRVRVGEISGFELTGDGFTAQKFPKYEQEQETRGDRTYNVVAFRTILTPSRAGKITLGPCEIPLVAQVPRDRKRQRRTMLDSIFGDDDFFAPFGGGGFSEPQRYKAEAPALDINVKPLPTEGRPRDFGGAVGQFQFTAETPTTRIKAGEPLTVRLTVRGEGNFDRVNAPALVDANGWQAYDASAKFEPSNEFKNSGTKTFEMPVVPQGAHNETPQFTFSYFDPAAEKYVTQTSKSSPLVVEGAPVQAPAPPPPATAETAPAQPPKPEAPQTQPTKVIAPLVYQLGTVGDFKPIQQRPIFWLWNGIAAVGALGLLGARLLYRDPLQKRNASLRRERDDMLRLVRGEKSPEQFYERAARVLQLTTACVTGADPSCVDAAAAKSALAREDSVATRIDEVFDRRGALLYAGGGGSGEDARADRAAILHTLEELCRR
jgi:hypothetical protein